MSDIRIVQVDPHDEAALQQANDVVRRADSHERPYPMTYTPLEMAVTFSAPPRVQDARLWVAFAGTEPVGAVETVRPLTDNLHLLNVDVMVLPDARRRGVGTLLAQHVFGVAREHGRTTLSAWVAGAPTDASGRPLSTDLRPGEAFAARWGLTNRLSDLHRVLDLPVPEARLESLAASAAPHHSDYRLVHWADACPPEYVADYCRLRSTIITEAPMGDLEMEDEAYDEARLRVEEDELRRMHRTAYTTAALSPDGDLVGHSMLVVPGSEPGRVYQWDTLVVPEHRGHRLGLALKTANQATVQAAHPDRTEVHTFNAAGNDPMSAVNDALGYRAVECMGEWQGPVPA